MSTQSAIIEREILSHADKELATRLSGFFKTGKGDYGEGDRFLGLKVPVTRAVVKRHTGEITDVSDIEPLIHSPWHEVRLAALLLLLELYRRNRKNPDGQRKIVDYYRSHLECGNNWDLVDLICPGLLGHYLLHNPDERIVLNELAAMEGKLWHQRVAIVSTLELIRAQQFDETFVIAENYLTHKHDLIHKATGWMLREVGKHGGMILLLEFLDRNASRMPRTMLRYAIERLPLDQRRHYMAIKKHT